MDATSFRRIMGNFATGVTIVTTATNGRLHGFTANSVTSVSLDPFLLLVCVDKQANAHRELASGESFGVSILAADQRELSDRFAQRGEPQVERLRGISYRLGETGVPLIEDALAYLECVREDEVEAGDHTIFLGRVISGKVLDDRGALLYFRGAYRELPE